MPSRGSARLTLVATAGWAAANSWCSLRYFQQHPRVKQRHKVTFSELDTVSGAETERMLRVGDALALLRDELSPEPEAESQAGIEKAADCAPAPHRVPRYIKTWACVNSPPASTHGS